MFLKLKITQLQTYLLVTNMAKKLYDYIILSADDREKLVTQITNDHLDLID